MQDMSMFETATASHHLLPICQQSLSFKRDCALISSTPPEILATFRPASGTLESKFRSLIRGLLPNVGIQSA
jgi:hypothetical protein